MTDSHKITSYFKSKSGFSMTPKLIESTKKTRQSARKVKSKKSPLKSHPPPRQILDYDSDCILIGDDTYVTRTGKDFDDVMPGISDCENDTLDPLSCVQIELSQHKYNGRQKNDFDYIHRDSGTESELPSKDNHNISITNSELDSTLCDIKPLDESLQPDTHQKIEYEDSTIFLLQLVESFLSDSSLHYLFETWETEIIKSLHEIEPLEPKKIFARMYWIMWKWYKSSAIISKYLKLNSRDNKTLENFIDLLQERGLLLFGNKMSLDEWTEVLTRSEIYDICKHFKVTSANSDKASLISNLKSFCSPKSTILQHFGQGQSRSIEKNVINKMSLLFGNCVKIKTEVKLVFDKLHKLMYLGANPAILREKKLNLLLINIKIGKQYYPAMNLKSESPSCAFPTRAHFVEYMNAHFLYEEILKLTSTPQCDHWPVIELCRRCCQLYKNLESENDLITWTPPSWLLRFTPGYCYIKSIELSIGSFKAQKELYFYEEALRMIEVLLNQKLYRQHKRALWYNEQTLILQSKLRNFQQAAEVLITALNETEMPHDSKAPLKDRAKRITSLKNATLKPESRLSLLNLIKEETVDFPSIHISARSTSDNAPGRKSQYYFRDVISGEKTYSGVEQYAIIHYLNNTEYTNGEHWEGRIITSIFGLLFWDIVYSPVESKKGIFLSPYQEAPLDLYTDDFYQNRKDLIENRLVFIEFGWQSMDDIITFMKDTFDSRKIGEVSIFHDNIEWEQIVEIVTCLGRDGLLSICKRLASLYYYCHSGFPDLTVWNPKTKKIKFVEVKGDGDRLSFKQIQWMKYLLKSGIQTEVCFVHKNSFGNNDSKKVVVKKSPKTIPKSPKKRKTRAKKVKDGEKGAPDVKISPSVECNREINVPILSDITVSGNSDVCDSSKFHSPKKSTPKKRKSQSPKVSPSSSQEAGVYLRSPNKISKGVGYFSSPTKTFGANRARKRLSLSLTRKKISHQDK